MDVHISVIADFKSVCPHIDVTDWCMSGHHWVMKRKKDVPKIINHMTWTNITPEMIEAFQNEYDLFLRQFDFFIVAYASVFAMIFEKYKKPILMLNTVRYDVPFCWKNQMMMLERYKACLQRIYQSKQLLVVSNNLADQLYLQKGTGIQSIFIPSLCLYTNVQYNPTKPQFIMYHGDLIDHPLIAKKQSNHEWSDIVQYRGMISIPYEISLMSLFEYFTAGMPLFFPSKTYWKSNPHIQSVTAYWGEGNLPEELKEFENKELWIDLSDIYTTFQSPNTYYFDSKEHLFELIENFTYKDDRSFREQYKNKIIQAWHTLLPLPRKTVFRI